MEELKKLYDKDNNIAYDALKKLEIVSTDSNELYTYFDMFLNMLNDSKTLVKIRGFRLLCSLAMWDYNNKLNKNIDIILDVLDSSNGILIRQCLSKLNLILLYKPELSDCIQNKLINIDLSKYKESMQSLIKNDIDSIINNI